MESIEEITIIGQIIYKRKFGKQLAFIYVLTEDKSEIEAMLKESPFVGTTQIGEIIKMNGRYETNQGKIQFIPKMICTLVKSEDCKVINKTRKNVQKFTNKPVDQRCLCKMFKKLNECLVENCTFRHYLLDGESHKLKYLAEKREEALKIVHENDPLNNESKLKKIQRHRLFSQFIVETFGLENLKSSYVLDIAGGKGMVSFHLMNDYGIKCIIVDPRGISLPKKQAHNLRDSNLSITEIKSYFDENFNKKMIKESSLIIGMHPDEATIDIVKTADKFFKNFAVVPCCVFPGTFPDRVLKNGEKVIEYTQLIKYIQELVENTQSFFLNIEGRNKIIYKIY